MGLPYLPISPGVVEKEGQWRHIWSHGASGNHNWDQRYLSDRRNLRLEGPLENDQEKGLRGGERSLQ